MLFEYIIEMEQKLANSSGSSLAFGHRQKIHVCFLKACLLVLAVDDDDADVDDDGQDGDDGEVDGRRRVGGGDQLRTGFECSVHFRKAV